MKMSFEDFVQPVSGAVPQKPGLMSRLAETSERIDMLDKSLSELQGALSPVLSMTGPVTATPDNSSIMGGDKNMAVSDGPSGASEQCIQHHQQLASIVARINSLTERVDL